MYSRCLEHLVQLSQHFLPSIVFRFAQPNRKHFYYKWRRQAIQQDTLNTGHKPEKKIRNMSHVIVNPGKEKPAPSELDGVKWCDIHGEWYIKS